MKKILLFVGFVLCFIYPFTLSLAEVSMDKEGDGGVEEKTSNEDSNNNSDLSDGLNLANKAKSAIIIESSTGKVIYEKNANERLAMASMTNIMTT